MKYVRLLAFFLSALVASQALAARVTQDLDFDWRFSQSDPAGAEKVEFDDSNWRKLDLPHDWSIEGEYRQDNPDRGAGAYLPGGVGWYRRVIDVPAQWKDKHVRIEFDAAQRNSDVYINGHHLGRRPYGYISFSYDLAPHLKVGRNVIAVRLDNPLPAARWYTGSGIYSHVRLVATDRLRIPQWGTFVTTGEDGDVNVATEVVGAEAVDARLVSEIFDENQRLAAAENKVVTASITQTLTVKSPALWSPQSPKLYRLVQRLYRGDAQTDEVATNFGFRTIRFDPDTGFWLNGKNIKLKGVGMHYDASPMGAAIPDEILENRLRRLKEMGCNAIRTGHTPFPPMFYELCDRLGLMVMNEAFDGWRKKVDFDYGATAFADWWKRDLTDFVRHDRNHPCVILWSIGNETGHADRFGMTQLIRSLDPTRPTTGGQVLEGVDVAGFNGPGEVPGVLEKFHREHPKMPIVLTEQTHAYQTRGFYRVVTNYRETDRTRTTPFEPYGTSEIFFDGDEQFRSSYDNAPVRITSRQCWKRTRDTPWISGEFRWAGFDYLGEAHWGGRHWPARHWHPGIHDSSGIPKDTAFFYQSQWTTEPMVHLLPHWTHPHLAPGTIVPVVAYSNCHEVELFLNGKSLGRKPPRQELLDFVWHVPYAAGELKAIGYRGGKAVVEKTFRTASAPTAIKLDTTDTALKPDRRDVATVTFSIRDDNGELVPWAMDRVEFRLDGPARLLGYENGNPIDITPHRVPYRNAFYGLGRGFLQAKEQDGPIELTAAAILGAREFENETTIAMTIERLTLRGELQPAQFEIRYTTDGSEPTPASPRFEHPLTINQPCEVRMLVLRDGEPYVAIRAQLIRASRATSPVAATQPAFASQPRDKQAAGVWREGQREFHHLPDGRVMRKQGAEQREVARWWYDYPDDVFEDEHASGGGEIRWNNTGETVSIRLSDRQGQVLVVSAGGPQSRRWKR